VPGAQQFEEIETALRTDGGEPGKMRVANLDSGIVSKHLGSGPINFLAKGPFD
jgi:hypothetical protein